MRRPAVFFDRDNTLIACDGYLGDPADVVLVDGAAAAVARARRLGYAVVIISNQSGVARGMFPEEAVHAVNARLDDLLAEDEPSAIIDRHAFCPFHPNAIVDRYRQDSDLRKPKPGMLHEAAKQLNLDLSQSWVIGDAPRDVEAGHAAGCRTILVKNPSLHASPAALEAMRVEPDFEAANLAEAMDFVERGKAEPESVTAAAADVFAPEVDPQTDAPPVIEAASAPAEAPAEPSIIAQHESTDQADGVKGVDQNGSSVPRDGASLGPLRAEPLDEPTDAASAWRAPEPVETTSASDDVPSSSIVMPVQEPASEQSEGVVSGLQASRLNAEVDAPAPEVTPVAPIAIESVVHSVEPQKAERPAPTMPTTASPVEPVSSSILFAPPAAAEAAPAVTAPPARRIPSTIAAAKAAKRGERVAPTTSAPIAAAVPAETPASPSLSAPPPSADNARVEALLEQILVATRAAHPASDGSDFSAFKVLSGVLQIMVLAVLFFAYLYRDRPSIDAVLLLALVFQTMTIALLIMGRQK